MCDDGISAHFFILYIRFLRTILVYNRSIFIFVVVSSRYFCYKLAQDGKEVVLVKPTVLLDIPRE